MCSGTNKGIVQLSSPECGYECAYTDTTSIPFKHGKTIKLAEGGSSVQLDIRISQFEAQVLPDADITVVRYCFYAGFPAQEGIRVQLNCGPTNVERIGTQRDRTYRGQYTPRNCTRRLFN